MAEGQNPPGDNPPKDGDPAGQKPPEGQGGNGDNASNDDPPGADQLGDAGKRALDTMKSDRNRHRDDAAKWKADYEALQAQVAGKEAEHAAQVERDRVKNEALGKANERILKAEIRAAAAGKLADPSDALLYIKLADFEVGEDGEVDSAALTAAIENLVKTKPYLAAQGARFQGSADGGARNEPPGKSKQEAIAEAEKNGEIRKAIRLRQELAAELRAAANK